jgi:uncharacterized membrane protein
MKIRRPGIDFTRGLAVLAMVFFHLSWDLNFQIIALPKIPGWYWEIVPDAIGATFFWVAGMSQALSPRNSIREGIKLLAWGLGLTVASMIYSPNGPIVFGVLHCLGLSKIVTYPFRKLSAPVKTFFALVALGLGYWLRTLQFHGEWSYLLMWIGFRPSPIPTMADYYPLLPDIGYMWLGGVMASLLYQESVKKKTEPRSFTAKPGRAVIWIGQKALPIYILHQPILFALLLGAVAIMKWQQAH